MDGPLNAVQQQDIDPIPNHPRYETLRYLNRGAHGFLILAKDRTTNHRVALKFLPRATAATKYVEREIVNQFKLRYPHVISLEEIFLTDEHLVLVMEFADKGDLSHHVMSLPSGLPEAHARQLFQQVMLAVDFCHRMGVANRDIKLDNILMVGDLVKLADFGFSKDIHGHSAPTTLVGTIYYVPPEVITNSEGAVYDGKKADMWSCGVVLYAMLTSRYPFQRPGDMALGRGKHMQAIISRTLAGEYPIPNGISSECADLLRGLLTVDPEKRFSVRDVFSHPWYREGLKPGVLEFNDHVVAELTAHPPINDDVIEQIKRLLVEAKGLPGSEPQSSDGDGVSGSL